LGAIDRVDALHRAVTDNGTDPGIDAGQHALRLTGGVQEQHARLSGSLVLAPPGFDRRDRLALISPAKDR
jgi:hypothetical protein